MIFRGIHRAVLCAALIAFPICSATSLAQKAGPAALDASSSALPSAPVPQADASQTQTSSSPEKQAQRERAARELKRQEKQRILGVIPNFNTSYVENAAPLSPKQKFQLAFRSSVDPFEFFAAGLVAGFGQATDNHSGYGQGAAGYFKRYGAAYADSADGNLWGNAIFPVLLHQDARYFRRGTGTVKSRLLYAISTAVWTKNDNGTWGPNYSNVLGNIVAGGISNLYYPAEDRGIGLTFQGAAIVTAEGALGSIGVEFWPDISRKLFHKHSGYTAQPAPK